MIERNRDVDFVKGVMIFLMVLFHLVYFSSYYLLLDHLIYSFHMPVFMFFSGYFFNFQKTLIPYLRNLRKLVVPYIVFSSIYYIAFVFVGRFLATENLSVDFSFYGLVDMLFIHPKATYWYIHTVIIASVVVYCVHRLKLSDVSRIFVIAILFWCLSYLANWLNGKILTMYFIGHLFRFYKWDMFRVLASTPLAFVPLFASYFYADLWNCRTEIVVINTFSVISLCVWFSGMLNKRCRQLIVWVGENTLQILLFSPFFVVLTKTYIPLFAFDGTRVLWALTSAVIVVFTCMVMSWMFDRFGVSQIMMGCHFIQSRFK